MAERIVLAFGGNALSREGERGTWADQQANARGAAAAALTLHHAGHELIITHGNGPQVGALALQQLAAAADTPPMPFDVLVAMTQGQLGYLLAQAFAELAPDVPTATIVTRVVVDPADPAFERPSKPIGPFYDEATARALAAERGWVVAADAGRGYRRQIASPRPLEVVEFDEIRALARAGALVIAGGGGGIPVRRTATDGYEGVEAVIDKDRSSAVLAHAATATLLVMATGVTRVALDFGTRWQRDIARLPVSDAERLLARGEFPVGSMGPKIEAATDFVRGGGRAAIITSSDRLVDAVAGTAGTWVVPDGAGPLVAATAEHAA